MKFGRGKAWVEPHRDRFRVRAVIDGVRKTVANYPDQEDAVEHADVWNREITNGVIATVPTVTLGDLGTNWIKARAMFGSKYRERVKTVDAERSIWSRHIATSDLGRMQVTSIRPRHVEEFARSLRGRIAVSAIVKGSKDERVVEVRTTSRTLSRSMQKHALRLVRAALGQAVRDEFIPSNPADGVFVAIGGRPPRDKGEDWLRQPEIEKLLGCAKISIRDRTVYATAIGLALRLGDLKALRVEQIHLDDRETGPHVRIPIEKSDNKMHRVPVPAWLDPWLRAHLATLPEGSKLVFPNRLGGRYGKSYVFKWSSKLASGRDRVPTALERAGVARKIGFHDLRGTCATSLALGSWGRVWSLHEIQQMLSHSDQRVTERYVRKALDSLSAAMRATPGGPSYPPGLAPTALH